MSVNSQAYIECEPAGPFAGRIDPWAEVGLYFQQLQSSFTGHLMQQIQRPLRALGYRASRERTIQVIEGREPDLALIKTTPVVPSNQALLRLWNYMDAAEAVKTDPGVEEVIPVELQAADDYAYQENALAVAIRAETGYHERALPFRRLLTEAQYQYIRQQITDWQQRLHELQQATLNPTEGS